MLGVVSGGETMAVTKAKEDAVVADAAQHEPQPTLYITDAMWAEWMKATERRHIETLSTILAAAPLLMNRASTQAQAGSIQGALMTARELVRINREGQA